MGKFLTVTSISFAVLCLYIGYKYQSEERFNSGLVRGKRVLVTGASTGIGEQLAYQYARMGATVMVTARREAALKKVVSECIRLSGRKGHHYVKADLADFQNIPKVIEAVRTSLGGLDILVLNHVAPYNPGVWLGAENLTIFDFHTKINFNSYVHLATHALPLLEESPGSSIIVINSVAGVFGFLYNSAYAGAKFALNGFFKSLRGQFQLFGQDISITQCFLGVIRTDAAKTALADKIIQHDKTGKRFLVHIPDEAYMAVDETALEVVKAGALRKEEMFYPKRMILGTYPVLSLILSKFEGSMFKPVDHAPSND